MTTITRNSYPIRKQLEALGGRWSATARGCDVPDERAALAHSGSFAQLRNINERNHRY